MTTPGTGIATLDQTEPRNILSLLPEAVSEKIKAAMAKRPDLFQLGEHDLAKALRAEGCAPNPTDHRMRMKFWNEYDLAQETGKNMNASRIYAGVCLLEFFHKKYLHHPEKVAWLVCPPVSYEITVAEGLACGMQKMREILDYEDRDPITGKLDHKLLELKAKITAMMDLRVKGGITQRVEQKNLHLNLSATAKDVQNATVGETMEDLTRRIKQLEVLERRALNMPKTMPEKPMVKNPDPGMGDGSKSSPIEANPKYADIVIE